MLAVMCGFDGGWRRKDLTVVVVVWHFRMEGGFLSK